MKIAFVHAENEFTTKLLNDLKEKLGNYEIVSWVQDEVAPADDFDIALVMGKFTQEQMAGQTKLALIHTADSTRQCNFFI